jgi:hypothetical protein
VRTGNLTCLQSGRAGATGLAPNLEHMACRFGLGPEGSGLTTMYFRRTIVLSRQKARPPASLGFRAQGRRRFRSESAAHKVDVAA